MNDIRTAAKQALEALEWHLERGAYGADIEGVTGNLRAALSQQAELSEGLGPLPPTTYVLARESDGYSPERLLSEAGYTEEHMRAYAAAAVALERDSRQALPVGEMRLSEIIDGMVVPVVTADLPVGTERYTAPPQQVAQQAEPLNLRDPAVQKRLASQWGYVPAAAQAEPDLSRRPRCNGPADNGFDRSIPPSPYLCTKCMAEPVEPVEPVAWRLWDEDPQGGGDWRYYDAKDFKEGIDPMKYFDGLVPLYLTPPRCPNCASLEAQNTELDRKLAELERAYENGYKAGVAAEREECAKVCERYELARSAAASIRARGNT